MKKIIILIFGLVVVSAGAFYFFNNQKSNQPQEQAVLEQTLDISTQYLALRYQTDNVLINAENFGSYEKWNEEMTLIIGAWNKLENEAADLEKKSEALPIQELGFGRNNTAYAYDRNEISDVFDKAPAGKKIATLAKYLGVDAKRAQMILNQDQNQVTADAWNEAGDALNKLEKSAVVIKDGCKIAGFVGTTALTGGSAALLTGSTLSKAAVIVSGADLTLEIGNDAASIALGNNNKISAVIDDARKITEPVSGLLTISTMPGNLTKGIEKLNAISFTAEQINSGAQEGKIIGIEIPEVSIDSSNRFENIKKYKGPVYISKIEPNEVDKWLSENNIKVEPETKAEIEATLKISQIPQVNANKETETNEKAEDQTEKNNTDLAGTKWKGVLVSASGDGQKTTSNDFEVTLNKDGSCTMGDMGKDTEDSSYTWSQEGRNINIFGENKESGYYVFELSGNTLVFSKIVAEGKEVMAGADFMGGKAPTGILYKQ